MVLSSIRRRLILVVMVVLSLALALPLAAFIPILVHARAATQETLTVPFANGPNGATTANSYTGTVAINVSGTGQASAAAYSDAFYVYTDNAGNPITPEHHPDFSLCINDQPVDNYMVIPPYHSNHTYQLALSVSDSPRFTFGVCDTYTADNTGSFGITVRTVGEMHF